MNKYQLNKARAIYKAIEYQHEIMTSDDCNEVARLSDKFYNLVKKYGLIKEFRSDISGDIRI